MKHLIILVLFSILTFCSCGSQNETSGTYNIAKNEIKNDSTIHVYYFHGSIRCETCVAVDEDTHNYLLTRYADKFKNKEITFQSINIDEKAHEDLIKKYKVWGQSLLFIKGKKVVDKTDEAFLTVTMNPTKWEKVVEQTMDNLLNN